MSNPNSTLTAERLRTLYRYDETTGVLELIEKVRGCCNPAVGKRGYAYVTIDGRRYDVHRLAWLYTHGMWPKDTIDHINCDKADNRIDNLRDVPRAINNRNVWEARKASKTGRRGVSLERGRYTVSIRLENGKRRRLGGYDDLETAAQVYLEAARRRLQESLMSVEQS
jgi:hypothetical protein